jgi:hypothetical protein
LLAQALERSVHDVVVMPQMPGESTGHVDLFLMALDSRTVLVPRLRDEALTDSMLSDEARSVAPQAQAFLDERASQLESLGLEVERLPMLPPIPIEPDEDPIEAGDQPEFLLLSPTNALLVPIGKRRTVLLPRFQLAEFPRRYRQLDRAYRRQWASMFRARGWAPMTVDATQLALGLGLLRCATYPVPL